MAQLLATKCRICDEKVATLFCYHCKDYICQDCQIWHQKFKSSKHHVMTDLHNIDQLALQNKLICEEHNLDFLYFCEKCDCLICTFCVTTNHQGHSIHLKNISDIVTVARVDVQGHIDCLKEKIKTVNDFIAEVNDTRSRHIENESRVFSTHVNTFSSESVSIVKLKRDLDLNRVSDFVALERQMLNYVTSKLNRTNEEYTDLCGKLEYCLSLRHDVAFFLNQKLLTKELKEISEIDEIEEPHSIEKFNKEEFMRSVIEDIQSKHNLKCLESKQDEIDDLTRCIDIEKNNSMIQNEKLTKVTKRLDEMSIQLTAEQKKWERRLESKQDEIDDLVRYIDIEKNNSMIQNEKLTKVTKRLDEMSIQLTAEQKKWESKYTSLKTMYYADAKEHKEKVVRLSSENTEFTKLLELKVEKIDELSKSLQLANEKNLILTGKYLKPQQEMAYKKENWTEMIQLEKEKEDILKTALAAEIGKKEQCDRTLVKEKTVYAAINIGETYTSYAFALQQDLRNDPPNIHTGQGTQSHHMLFKTRSMILTDRNGENVLFGNEVERKHLDLQTDKYDADLYYFPDFRKEFSKINVSRKVEIMDSNGKKLRLIKVFQFALKYLVDHIYLRIIEQFGGIRQENIKYILTIPVEWGESAREFMYEAAYEAGIRKDMVCLEFEPMSALVYCLQMQTSSADLLIGTCTTKYMIVNFKDETIDIDIYQIDNDGAFERLQDDRCQIKGKVIIDDVSWSFLVEIFGEKLMKEFQKMNPVDNDSILFDFKNSLIFDPYGVMRIGIQLPETFFSMLNKYDFDYSELSDKSERNIEISSDILRISENLFFRRIMSEILTEIRMALEDVLLNVQNVFIVGKFSEYEYVQMEISDCFGKEMIIYVPDNAELAVIKGAVLCGNRPSFS